MNTLAMTYVIALVAVLTVCTGAVGALIGIVARAQAHRTPFRVTVASNPHDFHR